MRGYSSIGILFAFFTTTAACAPEASDRCAAAIEVIQACSGEAPDYPAEGCLPSYEEDAERIIAGGCEAVAFGDRADAYCGPLDRLFGLCSTVAVEDAVAVDDLQDVCSGTEGALCDAMVRGDYAAARDAARELSLGGSSASLDPALRFYVGERIVALLVWNELTDDGVQPEDGSYPERAAQVLAEHFPAYGESSHGFAMARSPLPPLDGRSCASNDVIAYFPGVIRAATREGLKDQLEAVTSAFPCLEAVRIDTGNFVHPVVNAETARNDLARFTDPDTHFHFIGYSQGSSNSLRTLVDVPEVASRVVSNLAMNSAAHGSEVADGLYPLLADRSTRCSSLPEAFGPICERFDDDELAVVQEILASMGIPMDLIENGEGHLEGAYSLTTEAAADFWAEHGAALPRHVLYTTFRAIITDTGRNLPVSNQICYDMLVRAGGETPYNDMQVLLSNQRLGGPIADREVALPVAEGNHWQWELNTRDVADDVMPADMSERTPQTALLLAYFQTLYELGIFE